MPRASAARRGPILCATLALLACLLVAAPGGPALAQEQDPDDSARQAAVAAWEVSTDPEIRQRIGFVIETFSVEGTQVLAVQRHCLCGEVAKRYQFAIDPADGSPPWFITLGSYSQTTEAVAEMEGRPEGWRFWHLDGYAPGIHYTFAFFDAEPDYDDVAAMVRRIAGSDDPAALAGSSSRLSQSQIDHFLQ